MELPVIPENEYQLPPMMKSEPKFAPLKVVRGNGPKHVDFRSTKAFTTPIFDYLNGLGVDVSKWSQTPITE